jgi:hypothetical protein
LNRTIYVPSACSISPTKLYLDFTAINQNVTIKQHERPRSISGHCHCLVLLATIKRVQARLCTTYWQPLFHNYCTKLTSPGNKLQLYHLNMGELIDEFNTFLNKHGDLFSQTEITQLSRKVPHSQPGAHTYQLT